MRVVNSLSSENDEINAGVLHCSLLDFTHFLLYMNDLPENILGSLVNIYLDDATMYR